MYCTNCSSEVEKESIFCWKCGARIESDVNDEFTRKNGLESSFTIKEIVMIFFIYYTIDFLDIIFILLFINLVFFFVFIISIIPGFLEVIIFHKVFSSYSWEHRRRNYVRNEKFIYIFVPLIHMISLMGVLSLLNPLSAVHYILAVMVLAEIFIGMIYLPYRFSYRREWLS